MPCCLVLLLLLHSELMYQHALGCPNITYMPCQVYPCPYHHLVTYQYLQPLIDCTSCTKIHP
jgi:hypothetical protein